MQHVADKGVSGGHCVNRTMRWPDGPSPFHSCHGGQLGEVEVGALVADKSHFVTLHVHLAPGTTGVELAALVARRRADALHPLLAALGHDALLLGAVPQRAGHLRADQEREPQRERGGATQRDLAV